MSNDKILQIIKDRPFGHVPCIYIDSGLESPNILLYFHGNAEDISLAYNLLVQIRNNLEISILAMEYSGYGLYKDSEPTAEAILDDSEYIYNYLVKKLGY